MVALSPWTNKKHSEIELSEATIAELALWHIHNYLEHNLHIRSIEMYSYTQQKQALNHHHKNIPTSIIQVQNYIHYIAQCEHENHPSPDALIYAVKTCVPQPVLDFCPTALPCVLLNAQQSTEPKLLLAHCSHWHPWVREIASRNKNCPHEGKILANLL